MREHENSKQSKTDRSVSPLTERPAWKALEAHYQEIRKLHLRELFADDPERGERLTAEAAGLYLDYSKNRITAETLKLLLQLAEESGLRRGSMPCSAGDKINITENRAVLHVALRAPTRRIDPGGRQERRARGPRRARQDGRFFQPRPQRRVEGPHRQAHSQRRQHRHRRLRPRAGDGLRSAQALQRSRHDVPLRFQRRRHRFRRSGRAISIRRKPCSSSPRKPSRRWRR